MKRGLVNYRIPPRMDDGAVIVRRARGVHHCQGGHDGEKRVRCVERSDGLIVAGTIYIEYLGESPAFQSGARYHQRCAEQQGLIEALTPKTGGEKSAEGSK